MSRLNSYLPIPNHHASSPPVVDTGLLMPAGPELPRGSAARAPCCVFTLTASVFSRFSTLICDLASSVTGNECLLLILTDKHLSLYFQPPSHFCK